MSESSSPERRAFSRQTLALPLKVEQGCREAEAASIIEGCTRDVSNRGAYFWAKGVFRIGQRIRLSLQIPADSARNYSMKIRGEAEVIRVEGGKSLEQAAGVAVRVLHFETPTVTPSRPTWIN